MNVITKKTLDSFATLHADVAEPLRSWRKVFEKNNFQDIDAVRKVLPSADFADPYTIGEPSHCIVVASPQRGPSIMNTALSEVAPPAALAVEERNRCDCERIICDWLRAVRYVRRRRAEQMPA